MAEWGWDTRGRLFEVYEQGAAAFNDDGGWLDPERNRHEAGLLAVAKFAAGELLENDEVANLRHANAALAQRATRAETFLRTLGYK